MSLVEIASNKAAHASGAASTINKDRRVDIYFSADIETDGPIPGPYSMLSCALVLAGTYDGKSFRRPKDYSKSIYKEFKPISDKYEEEALAVNGLDRSALSIYGSNPEDAIREIDHWIRQEAGEGFPVLVAYPLSFDWAWLYWYFIQYGKNGSPFEYSRCFDMKTAFAVKARLPVSAAGRSKLPPFLKSKRTHTHNALDDAIEQAEIFANIFEWSRPNV